MSEQERLFASSQRIADLCRRELGARAAMVCGSVAKGKADGASDVDMCVYYDVVPSMEGLESVRNAMGGSERIFTLGDLEHGDFAEFYYVDGVKHDIVHALPERVRQDIQAVLDEHTWDSPIQKLIEGVQTAHVFYGEDLIGEWQRLIAAYPPELGRNMVEANLGFAPMWVLREMSADRGDLLMYYERLTAACTKLLNILMGLNRRYHWGEYKRMEQELGDLEFTPPHLVPRIRRILRAEPREAVPEMEKLIRETLALVRLHMPEVDVDSRTKNFLLPMRKR